MSIKKHQFTILLDKTLTNMNITEILKNGFETCGLSPLNVNAVNFSKVFKRIQNSTNDITCDAEIQSSSTNNKNAEFLRELENILGKEKLEIFESQSSLTWTGEIEDTSLFRIWYSLKFPNEVSSLF